MKRYSVLLAGLLASCTPAFAGDFEVVVDVGRERHIYNDASNCFTITPTPSGVALHCQTQQWVTIAPLKGAAPPKNGKLVIEMQTFNFVTGQFVTLTTYAGCRSDPSLGDVLYFVCKKAS